MNQIPKKEPEEAPKPSPQKLDRAKCPALLILDDERSDEYLRAPAVPRR